MKSASKVDLLTNGYCGPEGVAGAVVVGPASILIVESDPAAAEDLGRRVERLGCRVIRSVCSGSDAVATLECCVLDAVFLSDEIEMASVDRSLAEIIHSRFSVLVVIVAPSVGSARSSPSESKRFTLLRRPFSDDDLTAVLRCLQRPRSSQPREHRKHDGGGEHALESKPCITKSPKLELAHFSRLATMGRLAGGLIHELCQPLTAIQSYAALCAEHSKSLRRVPPAIKMALEEIKSESQRASDIVHRLRAFLRKQDVQKAQMEVGQLVLESVRLTDAELRRQKVSLAIQLSDDLPPVRVDKILLEQVLVNLILNALDAMQSQLRIQGKLTICATAPPGTRSVAIEVIDNGPGIESQHVEHIFEPFFSTKPKGLGIGLSISKSILDAHGGSLMAKPNSDGGMCFSLSLPVGGSHDGFNTHGTCD